MKKTFIYSSFIILFLSACNNDKKNLGHEYGILLEKEYAELESSDRYKTFKERYQLLTKLSQEVNNAKEIAILTIEKVDTLCFIPPNEENLQLNQDVEDKIAGKKDAKPFSSYINQSKEVNATIVAEGFHQNTASVATFGTETDLHNIADFILNKSEYLHSSKQDTTSIYKRFCDDRILMDRVNNSRYFLFLKDMVNVSSEYDKNKNKEEFASGIYVGTVYVYDLTKNKFLNSITIGGTNSEIVQGKESSIDFSINSDLNDNIAKGLEQGIKEKFGLKGTVTSFYKP